MPGERARGYGLAMSTASQLLSPHEIEQIELANATGAADRLRREGPHRAVGDTSLAFVWRFA
jgi:hypothetical protein